MNRREKLTVAGVCLALALSCIALYRNAYPAPTPVLFGATTTTDDAAPSHVHSNATTSVAGFQSAADKTASDQVANGPRSKRRIFEDFDCGGNGSDGVATLTNQVPACSSQFRPGVTNSGTVKFVTTKQDANHIGILQLETVTSTSSTSTIAWFPSGGFPNWKIASGQSIYEELEFQLEDLSDGTNTYLFEFGFAQASGTAVTDGITLQYSSASPSSGNFILRTCASSSCTTGTGGTPTAAVADTWYRGAVSWDGTTACAYINGTSQGCTTSTIPSANVGIMAQKIRSAGTASRLIYLDWRYSDPTWVTPRG